MQLKFNSLFLVTILSLSHFQNKRYGFDTLLGMSKSLYLYKNKKFLIKVAFNHRRKKADNSVPWRKFLPMLIFPPFLSVSVPILLWLLSFCLERWDLWLQWIQKEFFHWQPWRENFSLNSFRQRNCCISPLRQQICTLAWIQTHSQSRILFSVKCRRH